MEPYPYPKSKTDQTKKRKEDTANKAAAKERVKKAKTGRANVARGVKAKKMKSSWNDF